jgi:hypothetical protein
MAKKLGLTLAGVILCSRLLAAAPTPAAPAEDPALDLGQLLPATPNPPGPQYMISDQPPETQNRQPRPPAPARTERRLEELPPGQSHPPEAAPEQTGQTPAAPPENHEAQAAQASPPGGRNQGDSWLLRLLRLMCASCRAR